MCFLNDKILSVKDNFNIENTFKCKDETKRITIEKVCNGKIDCAFASDELNCKNDADENIEIFLQNYCKIYHIDELECRIDKNPFEIQNFTLKSFSSFKLVKFEGKIKNLKNELFKFSTFKSNFNLKILIIKNFFQIKKIYEILKKVPNIISLILVNTKLKFTSKINKLRNLKYLDVSNNVIENIKFLKDLDCLYLNYLDLSENKISGLKDLEFFKFLKILKLNGLKLTVLDKTVKYTFFRQIHELHFFKSNFILENKNLFFKNLRSIELFRGNLLQHCCLIWQYHGNSVNCVPKTAVYFSCSHLLNSNFARTSFWIQGIGGILLNGFSILSSFYFEKKSVFFYRFFINFSDFLTAFYALSIACVDFHFKAEIVENLEKWKKSNFCMFLGISVLFSLSNSLLMLLNLTIERFVAIVYPFYTKKFQRIRFLNIAVANILSIFLSIFPFIFIQVL